MAKINPMYHLVNTILDDKETAIFLGSGSSTEGTQDGESFPDFNQLMDKVLKKFGFTPSGEKDRLEYFLSIIEKWEQEQKLTVRLDQLLDGEPGPAHYYLAALSIALFGQSNMLLYLNVNYDDLIKKAFTDLERNPLKSFKTVALSIRPGMRGSEFQETVTAIGEYLKIGRPVIIKLFGDINSQIPVLRQEYMKFEPDIERWLLECMKKPMIIIGSSFSHRTLQELLFASRGVSPVFLVNPSDKIPNSIKNLQRVHHIKMSFSGLMRELLEIIEQRKPSITRNIEKILDYLPLTLGHPEWRTLGRDKLDFINKYATVDHRLIIKKSDKRGIGVRMKDHPVFKIGDTVIIEYRSDRKGYTVLFEQEPSGNVRCLLPSVYMPSTSVQAALNLLSPEPINISEPFGIYHLYAVFSTEPFQLPWPSYYAEEPLPPLSGQEMMEFTGLLSSRPRESWRITAMKYTIKYF